MMKSNYSINSYEDLEREEIRAKKRIIKHEEAIKSKLKTLPEQIVTSGITKVVSGIVNGNLFKSTVSIVKFITSLFSTKTKDSTSNDINEHGLLTTIKNIIKSKL